MKKPVYRAMIVAALALSFGSLSLLTAARELTVVQQKAPMFKEASISSPIVKYLEEGSRLNLLAVEDSFYMVSYGGFEGWVIPYSVRMDEEAAAEVEQARPAESAPQEDRQPETDMPGSYLVVINDYANVREGPGLDYRKIGMVYQGDRLEKFIKRGEWYRVRLPDSSIGFIYEGLVADADSPGKSTRTAAAAVANESIAEKVERLEREVASLREELRRTQSLLIQLQGADVASGSSLPAGALEGLLRSGSTEGVSDAARGGSESSGGRIIGNRATRVYHLPESRFYDKIPEEFRVYFRSEEQAREAGYTKSIN